MKILQLTKVIGLIALAGLGGAMAITNPSQKAYEEYAIKQLTSYLKQNVCTQAPETLGKVLQHQCYTIVDLGRPQIKELIALRTKRQNFLLFSIYRTELSVPSPLPSYHFETVGAFQKFYVYEAESL
jgi:hypothetical protein